MNALAIRSGSERIRGFTLVELLVAISIMAIVSIISWRGLSALVATRDRLGPEADEVRSLLTGFGQMELDLAHVSSPLLVPQAGSPVSVQSINGTTALQILRFSEPLPDGGSALEQVTYSVVDGALIRACSPPARTVQAAVATVPATVRLVAGVSSMQLRVWRANEGWVAATPGDPTMPPGVEVVVTRSDGSTLRRVLLVG
jgi:general secretion pathway protein J